MFTESAESLVQAARAASANDALLAGVRAVYRYLEAALCGGRSRPVCGRTDRRVITPPACRQCSRCCRFDAYGHNLFVSTAEMALFLRCSDLSRMADPIAGACPFLRTRPARCAARAARPLGCRLFFCDRSARWWQPDLYDLLHRRMRRLHEVFEVPYFYAEWLAALRAV